jgi:type IV secretory pathway VirB4 component
MAASEPSIINKFRIARLTKAANERLAEYAKAMSELGKKYGTEIKAEGSSAVTAWTIKPENSEAYMTEKKALDTEECDLEANPLPLEAVEGTNLTALDLTLLGPFVIPPKDY